MGSKGESAQASAISGLGHSEEDSARWMATAFRLVLCPSLHLLGVQQIASSMLTYEKVSPTAEDQG